MIDEDDKTEHETTGVAWAGTVAFLGVLLFIGTLIYLAHNHWHF
jgi:uncharacterized membrane protein YgdD (TMEM256/DUF423 family)